MPGAQVPESDVIMTVLVLHIIMIRHMHAGCAGDDTVHQMYSIMQSA